MWYDVDNHRFPSTGASFYITVWVVSAVNQRPEAGGGGRRIGFKSELIATALYSGAGRTPGAGGER
jgi:hypothetical protein